MPRFESVFAPLTSARDLTSSEAESIMHWLIGGEADEAEILQVLNALCDRPLQITELLAFARVMKEKATLLDHPFKDLVDTCGTGGGKPTFNISTAAAIVAAGAGVRIAKHGNRSTTGLGSADVLEALGVRLGGNAESLIHRLETVGIAFLFAPAHHPAMRHVASARKALGRRSVFNLLGPLVNPAGASRQLMGIYDLEYLELMAKTIQGLEIERAVLVHSDDGLDEISPCARTRAIVVSDGSLTERTFEPEEFGIPRLSFDEIQPAQDIKASADLLIEAISRADSARAFAVVPSASVAIWLAGLEPNLGSAAGRAKDAISSGAALRKLEAMIEQGVDA